MSKDFIRREKPRLRKKTFLIVCEGSCEKIYFENMKRSERLMNINIDIITSKRPTPNEVIDYAARKQRDREYDMTFCVIDGDVSAQYDLKRQPKIEVIISIPCFEIWLLLHYRYTTKEFHSCDDLIREELRKHVGDYEKSQVYHERKRFYESLKDNLDKAIENAKKLDEDIKGSGRKNGTSTAIYKLIEAIKHEQNE